MEKYSAVVAFGPAGIGKGTVCSVLARRLPLFHYIASGDIIRGVFNEAEQPCASGEIREQSRVLHSYIDIGQMVADDVVLRIFRQALIKRVERKEFNPRSDVLLVDGMYRTLAQARGLDDLICVKEVHNFTNVPNAEILRRIAGRRQKAIDAGKKPRTDDDPEKALRRTAEFYSETHPTLDFFFEKGIPIHCVDALPSADVVTDGLYQHCCDKVVSYLPCYRNK